MYLAKKKKEEELSNIMKDLLTYDNLLGPLDNLLTCHLDCTLTTWLNLAS